MCRTIQTGLLISTVVTALAVSPVASAAPANFFGELYTGDRTNFPGQVGFQFEANSSYYISSLGRAINPAYNGGVLQDSHALRLFDSSTQSLLGSATVDGSSAIDPPGYAVADLSSPVPISQGHRYVLTTHEYSGGPDRWRDSDLVSNYADTLATVTARTYGYGSVYPSAIAPGERAYGVPTFYTDTAETVSLVGRNFQNKAYTGTRNDHTGQVGAHFQAFDDFEIKALARGAAGGSLSDSHTLRLWDFDTQQVLGQVTIDGNSPADGNNVLGLLPQPVTINKGQRFLITTTESDGGADTWYDAQAGSSRMIDHLNLASVVGAVSGDNSSFPTSMDRVSDGFAGVTFYGDLEDRGPGANVLTDYYSGDRNNHSGVVGFRFTPERDMMIDRLGRAVSYRYHDNELVDEHQLFLWVETEDGSDGTLLASVTVGPGSPRDDMNYAYGWLDEHIQLYEDETYRLVSEEFSNGSNGDPWQDSAWIPNYDASRVDILQSVWSSSASAFPANLGPQNSAYGVPTMFVVPEPTSVLLLVLGLALGFLSAGRRSKRL